MYTIVHNIVNVYNSTQYNIMVHNDDTIVHNDDIVHNNEGNTPFVSIL
jgi:hypothetical protein